MVVWVWAVEVADCRWQSFCNLTESADESRPLQDWWHTLRLVVGFGVPDEPWTRTNGTIHAEQRNRQIKIILMNLLPVAHTVARPDRNEKIILILIRITAECDKHPNADLPNGTYAAICRGDPVWSPTPIFRFHLFYLKIAEWIYPLWAATWGCPYQNRLRIGVVFGIKIQQ